MAALRATRFAAALLTGTTLTTLYTVPSGHKIILKSWTVASYVGAAHNAQLRINGSTFWAATVAAYPSFAAIHFWMVFEAGDVIGGLWEDAGGQGLFTLSGSLMTI